jgi:large subunit ribosomal protein L6
MSRIGKKPVTIPSGVAVRLDRGTVAIEGPLGKLQHPLPDGVTARYDNQTNQLAVLRQGDDRQARAIHGLSRALVQNMVIGVTKGYEKRLEIVGVGYLAAVKGDTLELRVGFAEEVHKKIPAGLNVSCPDQTHVVVKGCDKQLVGQFAAEVRAVRLPEPYKGKGVRYQGEHVKIKPGKAAT